MSEPSEPKWDWRGKYFLPVASAVTVLLLGSLAFYLTGGWKNIFEFLGKPVTVPLVGFLFLLLGWLLLAVAVAAGAVVAFMVYKKIVAKPPPKKPAELTIDGIKWRMDRGTLDAFCPKCDMELARKNLTSTNTATGFPGYSYRCEGCGTVKDFEGQTMEDIQNPVRRKIEHLLRKGN